MASIHERTRANGDDGMTITDFLLARIAEDEAEAEEMNRAECYDGGWSDEHAARVLAECAAKRAIVERAVVLEPNSPRWAAMDKDAIGAYDEWEDILHTLATVYREHPDYDARWEL